MGAAVAVVLGVVVLAGMVYDVARLASPRRASWPPLVRLLGRRRAAEADERWCAGLLSHGRIDAATYRRWMTGLAHGGHIADHGGYARFKDRG